MPTDLEQGRRVKAARELFWYRLPPSKDLRKKQGHKQAWGRRTLEGREGGKEGRMEARQAGMNSVWTELVVSLAGHRAMPFRSFCSAHSVVVKGLRRD